MRWVLAYDGGATRTRAGLYTRDRVLVAEAEAEACNPVECGVEACVSVLASLARTLTQEPVSAAAAGISGAKRTDIREAIARSLCAALQAGRVRITDDLHPVLHANVSDKPAVLVIAGTGSSVLAQAADGQSVIIGGRGRLFGDEGSAYQIAESALRAAADAVDGMGPKTALVHLLPSAAGVNMFADLVPWSATATKRQIAALASVVDAAALDGDAIAATCLKMQAQRLAWQTLAALTHLDDLSQVPILLQGGVFEHSTLFYKAYKTVIATLFPKTKPALAPLRGHHAVLELALAEGPIPSWASECTQRDAAAALPATEQRPAHARPLDRMSAIEIVRAMNAEDARIPNAVARHAGAIAAAIEAAAHALASGGRIIYVGAGTSGRLAALDAAECPPTFGVPRDRVLAVIAGGARALEESVEGAEDDVSRGRSDLRTIAPPPARNDVVIGVTASGRTPYVLAALEEAESCGATTILVACNPVPKSASRIVIALDTGPELLPGSTRLKAGTATKLVLNTISTGAMALSGYVYEGWMVCVRPVNAKLRERAVRIVAALTGLDAPEAERLLDEARGKIPVAVLMHNKGLACDEAVQSLEQAGGILRNALPPEHPNTPEPKTLNPSDS